VTTSGGIVQGDLGINGSLFTTDPVTGQPVPYLTQTEADQSYVSLGGGDVINGDLYISGNVGIGTTNPEASLEIRGNILARDTGRPQLILYNLASNQLWSWLTQGTASSGRLDLRTSNVGESDPDLNTPIMSITPSGYVGIGTTDPTGNLHLADETAGDLLILERTDTNFPSKWKLVVSASAQGDFAILDAMNDNARRFYIDNQGHVGIGTAYPATTLDVSGPLRWGAYTKDALPPAGVPGRLARVTDDVRGLWIDQGEKWFPMTDGVAYPQWWGADGSDEVDDAPAIQAALDATHSVELPCGTYLISKPLMIRSDQQIRGNGPCSRIKADGKSIFNGGLLEISGEDVGGSRENKSRISIKNLVLDGNRDKYEYEAENLPNPIYAEINGIHLGGADHVIIDTVWIENISSRAAYGMESSFGDGITISGTDNEYSIFYITINNVIIRGFSRNGISLTKATQIAISNFVIDNNGYFADPGIGIDI
jgi:hypothetical protein